MVRNGTKTGRQQDTVDRWGIDPLSIEAFNEAENYTGEDVIIDAALDGFPQKLAFDKYNNQEYWTLILHSNGLVHPSEMVAGMRVKVPIKNLQPRNKVRRTTKL